MTGDPPLAGLRILVVEDEYFIADDIKHVLREQGANVVILSGSVEDARARIDDDGFEVALIDISLRGEMAFSLADELKRRNVPFGFVTGYNKAQIPQRFADAPYLTKPWDAKELVEDVQRLWRRPTGA